MDKLVRKRKRDPETYNPILLAAAATGDLACVKMAIAHGADRDARDQDNSTPLILAVKNKREDVVAFLLKEMANPYCKDDSGIDAKEWAVLINDTPILSLICDFDREISYYNKKGLVLRGTRLDIEASGAVIKIDAPPEGMPTEEIKKYANTSGAALSSLKRQKCIGPLEALFPNDAQ